jgi:CheY-like chemotaxis protein
MISINSLSFLLVEDSVLNQRVAALVFKQMGLQFDIASNGQEALDLAKKTNYDIILMDIHMPVMDGLEATRLIREHEKESNISIPSYIVALSASEVMESRDFCYEVGIDEFIEKPIKESVLRDLVLRTFE